MTEGTPTTSGRLLSLLSLLQTPREWPGPELARRLAVSERTVRNDVERLRRLGYPVRATRGAAGGYRLAAGQAMPPLLLDDAEAVAVAVALGAAHASVVGMEETSLGALTKLLQVLPTRLRGQVDALRASTVRATPRRRGPEVSGAVLADLAGCIRDREVVRFGYADHAGATTERRAEPYRLVSLGQRWYLVATTWSATTGEPSGSTGCATRGAWGTGSGRGSCRPRTSRRTSPRAPGRSSSRSPGRS